MRLHAEKIALALAIGVMASASAATLASDDGASAPVASSAAVAQVPASFVKQCSKCHEVKAGAPESEGPNLLGLASRKAGSTDFPEYSQAIVKSGIIWNAETLDRYIADPNGTIPGGTMDYKGLSDPDARREIVQFVLQLPNS